MQIKLCEPKNVFVLILTGWETLLVVSAFLTFNYSIVVWMKQKVLQWNKTNKWSGSMSCVPTVIWG